MFPLAHMGIPLLPLAAAGRFPKRTYLIILGGLLPDLIDKPLGHLVLPQNNGRIVAHTLVFAITILVMGMFHPKLMFVAYGVLSHLLLDQMFLDPGTSFWPLLGGFGSSDFHASSWISALGEPVVLCMEGIGLAGLAFWSVKSEKLKQFIIGRNGE
jgi:hypothetical protein